MRKLKRRYVQYRCLSCGVWIKDVCELHPDEDVLIYTVNITLRENIKKEGIVINEM